MAPAVAREHQDPLYRLFFREGSIGSKLLVQVRRDLADVVKVCQGELKQTNHLRTLMSSLTKGTIPTHWRRYKVHKAMGVSEWISNFARRLAQLDQIASLDNLNATSKSGWAAVAHRKRWSLETLRLQLDIEKVNDPGAFIVDGLVLEGASWAGASTRLVRDQLSMTESLSLRPCTPNKPSASHWNSSETAAYHA
ncbi:hypothetical protein NUW54_g12935 [Trametes sanguinea]|uniref:Uncharacterized protein n=1 Tax=Trametes sanguinea TaxID=158606 RepID=A0ACC1MSC0_9APHY|nr:hypothetical protein NUW54_g12935 [Trametes sanguinea]